MPGKKNIWFDAENCLLMDIPQEKIEKWQSAYPTVDIQAEIKHMEVWLDANPRRRPRNYSRFIVNWLSRTYSRSQNNSKSGNTCKKQMEHNIDYDSI